MTDKEPIPTTSFSESIRQRAKDLMEIDGLSYLDAMTQAIDEELKAFKAANPKTYCLK